MTDDSLLFAADETTPANQEVETEAAIPWNILIIDDEEEVHVLDGEGEDDDDHGSGGNGGGRGRGRGRGCRGRQPHRSPCCH